MSTNKRQQPYHTSVEHTAPPTGGAGPTKKTKGPAPKGGEGTRPNKTGKATNPNKTTTKGGYQGVGGGGGVWQPCIRVLGFRVPLPGMYKPVQKKGSFALEGSGCKDS